jgi:cytoskeletal protein CcmA (bactofilin family)
MKKFNKGEFFMAVNTIKKDSRGNYDEYNSSTSKPMSHSYLGKTLKIKGQISTDEFLTVEGEVKGNIKTSKTVTIGKSGYVDGKITAEKVKVDGRAKGSIIASDKLEISSSGNFHGDLKSERLVIEEGALFQGNANMDD